MAAVDREVAESSGGLLQLDINVGPISAGCPIVDDEGRLRGIIGYQKADSGHSATFALPASRIVALLQARRDNSLTIIRRGRLGVQQIESEGKVIAHPINGGPPSRPVCGRGTRCWPSMMSNSNGTRI